MFPYTAIDTCKRLIWNFPINDQLKTLIKQKHKLWSQYMQNKSTSLMSEFKKVRKRIRRETRFLRGQNQNKIALLSKSNPKVFWKYVNSRRKTNNGIGDLKVCNPSGENYLIKIDCEKADTFCKYFSSIYTDESLSPYTYNEDEIIELQSDDIKFDTVNVLDKLSKLNIYKSPGGDGLHPRVLFELRNELALPLSIILNALYKLSKLPVAWKQADISPIYKKGSKLEVQNYRPISLTSVCCKVMESIIRDSLYKYLIQHKILSDRQYGFIKNCSTTTQLLKIIDDWTEKLELGGQIDVIYTDLNKAFDTVPHKRLIYRMRRCGFNLNIIKWVKDFLTDRRHRVKINDSYSPWHKVLSGVPQGSVLGPILFLIYINDLIDQCETHENLFVYADDAKIYKHITSPIDIQDLQHSVNNIKKMV